MQNTEANRLFLWRSGCTDAEIAERMNMSPSGVQTWRSRRGLKSNGRKKSKAAEIHDPGVQLGDRYMFIPAAFTDKDQKLPGGELAPVLLRGTVVWIHPRRRFFLAEADLNGLTIRECFAITER